MHHSALYQWTIEDLLKATFDHDLNNPKFFFIKPESLCIANKRWEEKIYFHTSEPEYVSYPCFLNEISVKIKLIEEKKFDKKLDKNGKPKYPKKFDEIGKPKFSSKRKKPDDFPDQLLIFEINGELVHNNLTIQPDHIKCFKAINQLNCEELGRVKKITYYSATLGNCGCCRAAQ